MVLVAPIPRYVTKKCCEDPSHTENYNCDDFELEIVSGIGTHKRLLESWAHEHSMNYVLVDATELADPAEPILRNRTTREGVPLWSNWDPVHLAPEAYRELADAVLSAGDADTSDTGSEAASSASCTSYGKCLPESVITVPEPPAPKRGRNALGVKPAGWLRASGSRPLQASPVDNMEREGTPWRPPWTWPAPLDETWSSTGGRRRRLAMVIGHVNYTEQKLYLIFIYYFNLIFFPSLFFLRNAL